MDASCVDVKALVRAVREHAQAQGKTAGWDYIAATYMDFELVELLDGCKTERAAIERARRQAQILDRRRQEFLRSLKKK